MLHERTPDHVSDDPASVKQALLALICAGGQPLWALSELDRVMQYSDESSTGRPPCGVRVEDAVADLYAAGLIHRFGQFVFASRAAVEAEQLAAS